MKVGTHKRAAATDLSRKEKRRCRRAALPFVDATARRLATLRNARDQLVEGAMLAVPLCLEPPPDPSWPVYAGACWMRSRASPETYLASVDARQRSEQALAHYRVRRVGQRHHKVPYGTQGTCLRQCWPHDQPLGPAELQAAPDRQAFELATLEACDASCALPALPICLFAAGWAPCECARTVPLHALYDDNDGCEENLVVAQSFTQIGVAWPPALGPCAEALVEAVMARGRLPFLEMARIVVDPRIVAEVRCALLAVAALPDALLTGCLLPYLAHPPADTLCLSPPSPS